MQNILVTGGAGYIGSHTAKALAQAGYCPITFDNFSRGNRWAVKWGPLVESDLSNRDAIIEVIKTYEISAVLHFAAYAYVGESMQYPEMYFENNVVKSLTLLEAMRLTSVKRLIFSSTCAVYGTPELLPITEASPPSPINPYGESKLMIEQAMRWHGAIHGLQWIALRYFNACGADPDGEIGEAHDPEPHLIPLILDVAMRRREAVMIYGNDYPTRDGTCIRDYIHVTDLASAHVRALQFLAEGGASQPLNLGTGYGYTVAEMIAGVEAVTGRKVAISNMPRRQGDPAVLTADPSRANTLLDWRPHYSELNDMLASAWAWHQRG